MSKVDILMPRAMLPVVMRGLEEKFTVHKPFEADDPEKLLEAELSKLHLATSVARHH